MGDCEMREGKFILCGRLGKVDAFPSFVKFYIMEFDGLFLRSTGQTIRIYINEVHSSAEAYFLFYDVNNCLESQSLS